MTCRPICFAWFVALRGVDQIDNLQVSPQRASPQLCPNDFDVTVQPFDSAVRSAFSMSLLGCLARATP